MTEHALIMCREPGRHSTLDKGHEEGGSAYANAGGNSMVVQWLGLGAFTARPQVQSLVGELRSCKPGSMAKKRERRRL